MPMTEKQSARLHDIIRAFEGVNGHSCQPWAREFAAACPGMAERSSEAVRGILAADDQRAASEVIGMFNGRGTVAAIKLITSKYEHCRSNP